MTPEEVRARVAEIAKRGVDEGDDESAHAMEDALYEDVLRAVAEGKLSKAEMMAAAAEALKTEELDFERWFA